MSYTSGLASGRKGNCYLGNEEYGILIDAGNGCADDQEGFERVWYPF